MSHVDIGFSETCDSWRLKSQQFPSKIGGKPAWLGHKNLPTLENLQCAKCQTQLIFLCQVYAPYEDCEQNFHRTLFIFICKNPACTERSVKAFRSNLPRRNEFYSYEPPGEAPVDFNETKWVRLCNLCGCPGEKTCSKCKHVFYCCREHQVIDWKESHKNICSVVGTKTNHVSSHLFPESELVIESEDYEGGKKEVDEQAELEKFNQLQAENKTGTLTEISDEELEQHAAIDGDKTFTQFKKRVAGNPEQILRYERGGVPLWIAAKPVPDKIPECEQCGGERQFEFQIMPQLLNVLKEDELDFGILVVYSCKKSCWEQEGYKSEFVFKQDVTE